MLARYSCSLLSRLATGLFLSAASVVAPQVCGSQASVPQTTEVVQYAKQRRYSSSFRNLRYPSIYTSLSPGQTFTIDGELWGNGKKGWNPFRNTPVYLFWYANGIRLPDSMKICDRRGYFRFDTVVPPAGPKSRLRLVVEFRGKSVNLPVSRTLGYRMAR
jgi:hypothetical protein